MGSKTFCHIEYPVRSEANWNKAYARKLDNDARKDWEENYSKRRCSQVINCASRP